jgi:hypothetical protein
LEELYLLEHIARIAREPQQWELAQHAATLMISFDPNCFGAHYAAARVAQHTLATPQNEGRICYRQKTMGPCGSRPARTLPAKRNSLALDKFSGGDSITT